VVPAAARESEEVEEEEVAPTRSAGRRAAAREGAAPIDQTTKIGLIVTGGLGLVVLIVVMMVRNTHQREQAAREAIDKEVASLLESLNSIDSKDMGAAERALKLAEEKETVWRDHRLASDIQTLIARLRSNLSSEKAERESLQTLTDLEQELQRSDVAVARLKEIRRQLEESEAKLANGGAEVIARVTLARKKAEQTYATQLLAEAKAVADASPSSPRPALTKYQTVEDELLVFLDRASRMKIQEDKDLYTPLYQRAISETDVLATALFASDGERLAWLDCLAPPQDGFWNPSSVKGFSHKVDKGTLLLNGPDAGLGEQGLISIGDREQWRHFQLDVKFKIEKGNLDFIFHLGKGVNANSLSYPFHTEGTRAQLKAGKEYSVRVTVVGSLLGVRYGSTDLDVPIPYEEKINWTVMRHGAIGIVVSPEARATFTRFQVREVR
jgi:hypothetical protein